MKSLVKFSLSNKIVGFIWLSFFVVTILFFSLSVNAQTNISDFSFTEQTSNAIITANEFDIGLTATNTTSFLTLNEYASGTHYLKRIGLSNLINTTDVNNLEIRFGQGTQKAHRFTIPAGSGAGVAELDYTYQDYVDVPFQVWDIDNDKQLMVSFRDQQDDGNFNLIEFNGAGGDEANHSREYLFIHNIDYALSADVNVAVNGGQQVSRLYFLWPYLTSGGSFDANNLPVSNLAIEVAHSIVDAKVTYGIDLSALVPTITIDANSSVTPISGLVNDFTEPRIYKVTAQDGVSFEKYLVNLTYGPNPVIEADSLSLLALYNSTDGANWTNPWNLSEPVNDWYGVTVTDGRVTSLKLANNLLSGIIPTELGNLTNLTYLELHINQLSGELPIELGNLTGLTLLTLYSNQLNGTIPINLGTLTNLIVLFLGDNQLSGSIPASLGNLHNLTNLAIGNNNLTGEIPQALGGLVNVKEFSLAFNQLTGPIPAEIWNLTNLDELRLQSNNFSGTIPEEVANLGSLTRLLLDNNPNLSGSIPNSITALGLEDLTFSGTMICEPTNALYQTWKSTVTTYQTSGIACDIAATDFEAFSIIGQTITGTLDATAHTVAIEVAFGTDVTALISTFTLSSGATAKVGTTSQVSGITSNNFTNAVTYTITAEDASTIQDWAVTITIKAPNNETNITAFSFPEQISLAVIDDINGTIDCEVLTGSDVTALVAHFTLAMGANAQVNAADQVSGVTLNDFTSQVIFTILAQDGSSTSDWTVQVAFGTATLESDSLALIALYNSTGGPSWTNTWGLLRPISTWHGVTITDGRVTSLDLNNNRLTGQIPLEIGNLTGLTYLDLKGNQLTGSIPTVIGNLVNLTYLALSQNQLSGNILSEIGFLSELTSLDIGSNNFSGTIPSEIWNLTKLEYLKIYSTSVTGIIPVEIENLAKLKKLDLWDNQLTGSIPSELGNLTNLTYLNLRDNQLTNNIPIELGSLINLTGLYLYNNQLTGSIPSELGSLTNLIGLHLYNNKLTGSIPYQLGNLINLSYLNLKNNQLNDIIPNELGNLTNLTYLNLTDNQLSGNIPIQLGSLTNLTYLNLTDNQLTGNIPDEFGALTNLTNLNLKNNLLTGSIPNELGSLTNLVGFYLYNNQLTGSIPNELGNLLNLTGLYLYNNQLTGSIPNELGSLTNLTYLNLSDNQLIGNIPNELGSLTNLTYLNLTDNQLTGNIPIELGNLTNLGDLYLYNNQLTGSIPYELGGLTNLTYLNLKNNQLSDIIPNELGNLTNLTSLFLNNNPLLTGSVPQSLTALSLDFFGFQYTDVCEPTNAAFQSWKIAVTNYQSSDIDCDIADTDFEAFSIIGQSITGTIDSNAHTVNIEVVYGTDITALISTFTLSSGATAKVGSTPQVSGTTTNNFTNSVTYTITAEDLINFQDWTVTITVKAPNTETDILTFTLPEETTLATLDAVNHTVDIEVAYGTDASSLIPTILISPNATVEPATGVAQDYSSPFMYTVTAEDGTTTQDWIVTVTTAPSNETDIIGFSMTEQTGAASIGTGTIDLEVAYGTDVSSLTPTILVSTNAMVAPATGVAQNFTNPVTYTVTAEDGTTTQDWIVTITIAQNIETDIIGFSMTEETGASIIDPANHTIDLEVAFGTDVSSLTPTIVLSPSAMVAPSAEVAQDYSSSVIYTVTAEDGTTTQDWIVTVTIAPNIETDIIGFSMTEETGASIIDPANHTIDLEVAFGTDVSSLTPTIVLSPSAMVAPATGVAQDYSSPVIYIVTAEDGTTTQDWIVTVTIAPSNETEIVGFSMTEQTGAATIGTSTIGIEVAYGTDVIKLAPTIIVSPNATVTPLTEVALDYSSPVTYTVTAEDGTTTQDWIVTVTIAPSNETDIISFSMTEQTGAPTIDTSIIDIEVAYGTDVSSITPTFVLSSNATATPLSEVAQDYSSPVTYTVTAEDGTTTQDWIVTVTLAPNIETDILSFSMTEQTGAATIGTGTIDLEVAYGTDVSSLTPTIVLSPNATVAPVSGLAQDHSSPITYTVTAEDGTTTQQWIVTVTLAPSNETDIEGFSMTEQTVPAIIGTGTINIEVAYGTDVTTLTPTVIVSPNATVTPLSEVAQEYSSPVTYTVTAEDGTTTQQWIVTVTLAPSNETDITSFSMTEQTGVATFDAANHIIDIEVDFGTNLTVLIPTITLSEGATVDPKDQEGQDFTNPVTYTVTAEDGISIQEWVINVTMTAPVLGFEDQIEKPTLYPNPVNHQLILNLGSLTDKLLLVSVADLSGKEIDRLQVTGKNEIALDVTNYDPGVYFVSVQLGKKRTVLRFIKN